MTREGESVGDVLGITATTALVARSSTSGSTEVRGRRVWAKRVLDVSLGAIALVLSVPLLVLAAIAIRISSHGPMLFRQQRIGQAGKPFTMWKFRTMRVTNDDSAHRAYVRAMLLGGEHLQPGRLGLHKLDDDRVTAVGRLLRRTSVDELPQLFNVLRGDMSLVGPRPALPWEVELFSPIDRVRFDVKPGITGLWQVSGRSRLTMRQALELDRAYVTQQSFLLDLKILLKTVPVVLVARDAA
jgi:lipopolysaccharide/colanic/teichoic acid biosynthesis glycosyltransferase